MGAWLWQARARFRFHGTPPAEDVRPRPLAGFAVGKLDAVVGQDGMCFIGYGGDQVAQGVYGDHFGLARMMFGGRKF